MNLPDDIAVVFETKETLTLTVTAKGQTVSILVPFPFEIESETLHQFRSRISEQVGSYVFEALFCICKGACV